MKGKAIVFIKPHEVLLKEIFIPEIKDDEVLIEALFTGISPGTELRTLNGQEPNALTFPLIPGYSIVGRVIKRGKKLENLGSGTLVLLNGSCFVKQFSSKWGGHVSHAVCKSKDLIVIPDGINPSDATIIPMFAVSCHGVKRIMPRKEESAIIIGQGIIGQLAGYLLKRIGLKVAAVDLVKERLEISKKWGADWTINMADGKDKIKEIMPEGADIVVEASGVAANVELAGDMLKGRPYSCEDFSMPRLLLLASYSEKVCFNYSKFLLEKEPDIITSRGMGYTDQHKAIEILANNDLSYFITKKFNCENARDAYGQMASNKSSYLGAVFEWAMR